VDVTLEVAIWSPKVSSYGCLPGVGSLVNADSTALRHSHTRGVPAALRGTNRTKLLATPIELVARGSATQPLYWFGAAFPSQVLSGRELILACFNAKTGYIESSQRRWLSHLVVSVPWGLRRILTQWAAFRKGGESPLNADSTALRRS
jgi:hypothetical protein